LKNRYLLALLPLLIFALCPDSSVGNRRHFTYAYESAVLPKASHELEIWNTVRLNRKVFYHGLDTRTEFEFGLGGNFQTSLYLNLSSEMDASGYTDQLLGFSNEWKYKILDAAADPIGAALYAEGSYSNSEIELEGKIILDKQIGDFLLAFNAVGEHSYVNGKGPTSVILMQTEDVAEFDGGAAYFITQNFTVGVEAYQHTKHPPSFEGGGIYSAFFAGLSLSYSGPNWWTAASVMPQIGTPELTQHEKLEARLLLAFEF